MKIENQTNLEEEIQSLTFYDNHNFLQYNVKNKNIQDLYKITLIKNVDFKISQALLFENYCSYDLAYPPLSLRQKQSNIQILKDFQTNLKMESFDFEDEQSQLQKINIEIDKEYFKEQFNIELDEENKQFLSFTFPKDNKTIFLDTKDLNCLRPMGWLNDQILNFWTQILQQKEFILAAKKRKFYPLKSYYIFNSFFCHNVKQCKQELNRIVNEEGDFYAEVEKKLSCVRKYAWKYKHIWEKTIIDLTKYDYLFIPMFGNSHWNLLLIVNYSKYFKELKKYVLKVKNINDLQKNEINQTIYIFGMDSYNEHVLLQCEMNTMSYLLNQFTLKILEKKLKLPQQQIDPEVELDFLKIEQQIVKVQHQKNGYDCGYAVLENIESCILKGEKEFENLISQQNYLMKNYNKQLLKWKRKQIIELIISLKGSPQNLKISLANYIKLKSEIFCNFFNQILFKYILKCSIIYFIFQNF